ncbi:MAG: DUF262 domain-containing HNH endonuclease family protein [Gammaproteobacteria bacterium]|nr:DUF262 domain-containing HNH endonuclease family protein [Gammaproteobacteria bacterium]
MRNVEELFKAKAASLWDTMTSYSGTAGFRIPEYQRTFDWSRENIARLMEDTANGFYYLSQNHESFTFLGTLILVEEDCKEPAFDGISLAVVDGQQRLTTLVLTVCALIEAISNQMHILKCFPAEQKKWLINEANFQLNELHRCAIGQLTGRGRTFPFPRLIRNRDSRARDSKEYEYLSIISKFLMGFNYYYENEQVQFEFPRVKEESAEIRRFKDNFNFIRQQVSFISNPHGHSSQENILECETISPSYFKRKNIRRLFDKLDVYEGNPERERALAAISEGTEADSIIRLLLFSSYLMRCVVLTRVETDDESSAFDIFDALNTTGEPLTAIETLKPRVIRYESDVGNGYSGSESEEAFSQIDEHLNELYSSPDARQKETKELIISYALYVDGTKQPKDLSSQRKYLRSRFDKIEKDAQTDDVRRFVMGLGKMAYFRRYYWEKEGIQGLLSFYPSLEVDELQLCLRFIRDMNMSVVIPAVARYWHKYDQNKDLDQFLIAVRALTAFVVLRRAATGTTAGIDTDFRTIMGKQLPRGMDPLCAGLAHENKLPSPIELKELLVHYLKARRVGVVDEESWISRIRENPLAQQSRPLVRFLLLAAADQSQPINGKPGLWTRKNVIRTDEREYLTYKCWTDEKYSTVEHIAPESRPDSGWDDSIYKRPTTRQTLGNLVLLPQKENSSAGNSEWRKKKIFYQAITEHDRSNQDMCIRDAEIAGYYFSSKIKELLINGERLHLLDTLNQVYDWNEKFIEVRTENIASLAWDKISPWLFS